MTALTVTGVAIANAASDNSNERNYKMEATNLHSQGKHCNGTVGCDCSGFSPKTNGDEWEKAYCKKCGHKKLYHK